MENKVRLKKRVSIVVKDGGWVGRTGNTKDTELEEMYD